MVNHVLRDRGLVDRDAELEQLTVNPRGTPEWVFAGHLPDEITDLFGNLPSSQPLRSTLPFPLQTKPSPVPSGDGLGLDEGQRLSPVGPKSRQYDPKGSIPVG